MNILTLDFETADKYIGLGLGSGWAYKLNNPNSEFRVLGYSHYDGNEAFYRPITDESLRYLQVLIDEADYVLFHNAQYDLGCLLVCGIDISKIRVLDTKIVAYLYNSNLDSYSLDYLSKRFLQLDQQKKKGSLVDIVTEFELLRSPTGKLVDYRNKTYNERAEKWAYSHMDVLQNKDFEAFSYYAKQDVVATFNLFNLLSKSIELEQALYFSNFQKICVKLREKGIQIDREQLNYLIDHFGPRLDSLRQKAMAFVGNIENIDSTEQLGRALTAKGYVLPLTKANKWSTKKDVINELCADHPELSILLEYRELNKLYHDFLIKIVDIMQYTKGDKVFPEMSLFGAMTGRFASSCPNIQQIPKNSEKYGTIFRSIFTSTEGKLWWSLDWSNQEGRLALHNAVKLNAPRIKDLQKAFEDSPNTDMHLKVAQIIYGEHVTKASIERKYAKTINLGLMYGMGQGKLCKKLGFKTEMVETQYGIQERATKEGKEVLDKYHTYIPFVKFLNTSYQSRIKAVGYIETLSKRRLQNEPGKEYKALNKLIQGSAADMCLDALYKAYEAGIDIICIVHDEFNIQGTIADMLDMKHIMETQEWSKIPFVVDVSYGENWGQLNSYEFTSTCDILHYDPIKEIK